MTTKSYAYVSETRAQGVAQGRAEGEVKAVLLILESRHLAISEAQRAQITGCSDTERLDRWVVNAGKVGSVAELLAL